MRGLTLLIMAVFLSSRLAYRHGYLSIALRSQSRRMLCGDSSIISDGEVEVEQEVDEGSVPTRWVQPGHAYFVATPLGNRYDISMRAMEILSSVDIICAEDTRRTIQLLRLLALPQKKVISHHEHNQAQSIPEIIRLVKSGKSIAVVSDAGSPGIADPGAGLAEALSRDDVPMHPVPGPSALIAALSICGFQASEFTFLGFLPVKGRDRLEKLTKVSQTTHTVAFFEAPHRMLRTFSDLVALDSTSSNRSCVVCRELTKKHEEIKRGSVNEVQQWLQALEEEKESKSGGAGIRGEFTIVLGPVLGDERKQAIEALRAEMKGSLRTGQEGVSSGPDSAKQQIITALESCREQGMRRSEAAKTVAQQLQAPRTIVYDISLSINW